MIIGLFDVSLGNEERIMILEFFRKQDKIFLTQFEAYIKLRKFDSGTKIISTVMQHLHRAMILREDTSEIPIWLRAVLLWMVVVVVMVLIHKEDPRMWLWMINANEYVGFPIHIHFFKADSHQERRYARTQCSRRARRYANIHAGKDAAELRFQTSVTSVSGCSLGGSIPWFLEE